MFRRRLSSSSLSSSSGGKDKFAALDVHYEGVYGIRRWEALRRALLAPVRQIAWLNPFCGKKRDLLRTRHALTGCEVCVLEDDVRFQEEHGTLLVKRQEVTTQVRLNVSSQYSLDGASVFPALALGPKKGDRVLDACAAPGGKTLLLLDQLERLGGGTLVANEKAHKRRSRLRKVLEEYVPLDYDGKVNVQVTGLDAVDKRALAHLEPFDCILVDAPCSSERHFLRSNGASRWSPSRLKRDAQLQLAILRGLLPSLKPGGRIVYSTCALAHEENDDVVKEILENTKSRHGHDLTINDPLANLTFIDDDKDHSQQGGHLLMAGLERTEYGAIALPDKSKFGPLYWSSLTSLGASSPTTPRIKHSRRPRPSNENNIVAGLE